MAHKYLMITILLGLLGISHLALATQVKPVREFGQVSASVSLKGYTPISVKGDRISHLRGITGMYETYNDDNAGIVFIKPSENLKDPFSITLTTENNQIYTLHLTPKDGLPDAIVLQPPSIKKTEPRQFEKATPYTQLLTGLMKAMRNHAPLEDFETLGVRAKPRRLPGLQLTLIAIYNGSELRGKVYVIKNCSPHWITLSETQFYSPGDRAIALSAFSLAPHQTAELYKVVSR
jgi:type-F conjugative transfer system secretin TraK